MQRAFKHAGNAILLLLTAGCGDGDVAPSQRTTPVVVAAGCIDTIAGTGKRATDPVDNDADGNVDRAIPALAAHLDTPMDTVISADGTLLIIDWNGHKVRGLSAEGELSFVVGTGTEGDACEAELDRGRCPATAAEVNHPTDLFIDAKDVLWISAWHNSKLKTVSPDRRYLQDVCGTGNRKFEGDAGPCRDPAGNDLVSFDLPSSIVVDPLGNAFVSDQSNQVVRRIGRDGIVTTVAGHCPGTPGFGCPNGRGFSGDGGPATEAQLNNDIGQGAGPHGKLALDAAGNLYIADTINHAVRKVTPGSDGVIGDGDPSEELISTVAGTGTAGYSGDGGPATDARLFAPVDVAVAADGTLFIADTSNGCVRRVDPDGIINTVAGICGSPGYSGDGGPSAAAQLRAPYGVNLDGHGGLYIADGLNHRIRKVALER